MLDRPLKSPTTQLRVGSLFSGYGGLDLAVEEVFGARKIWFSEIDQAVARVYSGHWPDAPNLGDITAIDWSTVPPVDILCGGFPCQDVSTVGKMAGLAPGTRSGLWANMADAIDQLRPEWVVIENVRGLLSASAIRATPDDATPRGVEPGPWHLEETAPRPLRAAGAVLGDLADLRCDAQWIGLPATAIGAPHPRYRVFILAHRTLPNPTRLGRFPWRRKSPAGEIQARDDRAQSPGHRPGAPRARRFPQAGGTGDPVESDRAVLQRWGKYAEAVSRWEQIIDRPAPAPAFLNEATGPRPAPEFVEWLMGLPQGWVTDLSHGLTTNQKLAALGNGVLPRKAVLALESLRNAFLRPRIVCDRSAISVRPR